MSDYVKSTLSNGEHVVCRAHYHWLWWAKKIVVYAIFLAVALAADYLAETGYIITAIAAAMVLVRLIYDCLRYSNDEIVITNYRVVIKTRIIARDVFEMQIEKVETVAVDQSIMGRIFNYGRIACCGTGGTTSSYVQIADPLAFRAAFHKALKHDQENASTVSDSSQNERLDEIIRLLSEINSKLDRS